MLYALVLLTPYPSRLTLCHEVKHGAPAIESCVIGDSCFSASPLMSILLSLVLVFASVMIHYEALRFMNDCSKKTTAVPERAKVLAALVGALLSHLVQIVVFGFAYYLMRDKFGMGGFGGTFEDSLSSFIYFSSETYTTLGFGDIYPTGSLRLVCGIESLVGLLMVSWTASFTYLEMRRYW